MTTWQKIKQQEANVEEIPDIDREILDYLKTINLLPGVMTGVSCAGHPKEECKGRKGATTYPHVQLFFEEIDRGANFLVEIYKQGAPIIVGMASHGGMGSVVIYCPHEMQELPLPEQRERLFTNIITTLKGVLNEGQN